MKKSLPLSLLAVRLTLPLAGVTAALAACPAPECRTDLDCDEGEVCRSEQCVPVEGDAGPAPDAGAPDAGAPDAGADAGAPDAGVDAGATDAGMDAGATDAGVDAGTLDAGDADAGAVDGGAIDAGAADGG